MCELYKVWLHSRLQLDVYRNLVQAAARILEEGSNIYYGIEACNEVIDGKGPEVGHSVRHECLCIRAALLLKVHLKLTIVYRTPNFIKSVPNLQYCFQRKWKNDVYMAMRDCNSARKINASSFKAHYYMSEALLQVFCQIMFWVFLGRIIYKYNSYMSCTNWLQLGKLNEALEFAEVAGNLASSTCEEEMVATIKGHLVAG